MIVGRVMITENNEFHFLLKEDLLIYDLNKMNIHISTFDTSSLDTHIDDFLQEILMFVKKKTKKFGPFHKPYKIEMGVHKITGLHSLNKHLDFIRFFMCNEVEIYLITDSPEVFFEKKELDYTLLAKRQYGFGNETTQYFNGYQNITPEL